MGPFLEILDSNGPLVPRVGIPGNVNEVPENVVLISGVGFPKFDIPVF